MRKLIERFILWFRTPKELRGLHVRSDSLRFSLIKVKKKDGEPVFVKLEG